MGKETSHRAALVLALGFFLLAALAFQAVAAEVVQSFHSSITVRADSSLAVVETIRVSAEGDRIKRGIYRDFPTVYRGGSGLPAVVGFRVTGVLKNGAPEPFHVAEQGNGRRVYIGESDVFLSPGTYTYTLSYETTFQLGFFEDHDEIYWNVTGNGWEFPIEHASASVVLPGEASKHVRSFEAYTGPQGAKGKQYTAGLDPSGAVEFYTTGTLGPGEGLTVVVAWDKGFVKEPSSGERVVTMLTESGRGSSAGLAGTGLVIAYYLAVWFAVGRDPRRGTIVTRYTPPEGMSPAVIRYISRMGYDQKTFAAAVIGMAVKGHIRISEESGEYTVRKAGGREALTPEEQRVMKKLLGDSDELVIEKANHARISEATTTLTDYLNTRFHKIYFVYNGWYFAGGVLITIAALLIGGYSAAKARGALEQFLFMSVWLSLWSFGVAALAAAIIGSWKKVFRGKPSKPADAVGAVLMTLFGLPFFAGEGFGLYVMWTATSLFNVMLFPALIGLNVLFYYLLKKPTLAGRKILDAIEGFRTFLTATEKDRLNMLNPPERTPALFEKFLPYALALGVEQQWAEQFSDVLAGAGVADTAVGYSPAWYSGTTMQSLAAGDFAASLGDSLATSVSSSSTAPGSSSGSGGGGSSGGGGGGGGGGGW